MAEYIFDKILVKGIKSGQMPGRTREAINWYRETTRKNIKRVAENKFMNTAAEERFTRRPLLGVMYQYIYDAKYKATLPYYDQMPLMFPFRKVKNGFLGINLHYLPLELRAKLMDSLYQIKSDSRFNDATKLKLNYKVLQGLANSNLGHVCVKRYLYERMRTDFMTIHSTEWDIALFLPTERFVTNTTSIGKDAVWRDVKGML